VTPASIVKRAESAEELFWATDVKLASSGIATDEPPQPAATAAARATARAARRTWGRLRVTL
jgi:hypothetical protein